jgi:hypothetical protein
MVEDGPTKAELRNAFSKVPIISEFVENIYDDYEESKNQPEDEEDEEEICFATGPCLELPFSDEEPNIEMAKETVKALVIFAELCLAKDDSSVEKGSPEWEAAMKTYLTRLLVD